MVNGKIIIKQYIVFISMGSWQFMNYKFEFCYRDGFSFPFWFLQVGIYSALTSLWVFG